MQYAEGEVSEMKEGYTLKENFFWYFKQVKQWFPILMIKLFLGTLLFAAASFLEILLPTMLVKGMVQQIPLKELLFQLIVIGGAIGLTRALLSELENRTTAHQITVRSTLGRKITDTFLSMPYDFLIESKTRREYKKATDNATSTNQSGAEAFYTVCYQLIKNCVTILIFGLTISYFSPLLFLVVVLASLANYFGLKRVLKKRIQQKTALAKLAMRRSYLERISYQIEAAKDLRLYPTGPWLEEEMTITVEQIMLLKQSYSSTVFFTKLVKSVGLFFQTIISYGYLVWGIFQQILSLTEFTLYASMIARLNQLAEQLVNDVYLLQQANSDLNDYRQWIDTYGKPTAKQLQETDWGEELTLSFEDVSYCYSGNTEPTIKNLSFTLQQGQKVALVGANGAGKTTIVNLLTGLLTPTTGRILVNGQDIQTIDKEEYYAHISPVFQESIVLATSLGQNIALQENYSEERVWDALKKAGIDQRIRQLDLGLETELTRYLYEDGIELSGGETQRLMLARALYKGAEILVLDEPTAALDALAEEEMYKQYNEMTKEKASLFISHRLASTRFCDEILFIKEGRLVEQGTHRELLQAGNAYAQMYEVQSHYYKEDQNESAIPAI
jgi:ATP-binding cassette subfamily B protein